MLDGFERLPTCVLWARPKIRIISLCHKVKQNHFIFLIYIKNLADVVFGKEDHHVEMHCRLVEMASDEEKYPTPSNWELDQESLTTLAPLDAIEL